MLASAGFILDTWLFQKQLDYQQKLYYLARLAYIEVLVPIERLRDADA